MFMGTSSPHSERLRLRQLPAPSGNDEMLSNVAKGLVNGHPPGVTHRGHTDQVDKSGPKRFTATALRNSPAGLVVAGLDHLSGGV